ncbi:sensor histidine kinase [Deinococcus ruber]|uniref:sensor histidine kinase n=1 Tax=Deinococcus ruber TaxID=1848197 RepID=UPI003570CBBE
MQLGPALPAIAVDGSKLQQALGNLISNAFKYSPEDTPVVITARVQGTEVCISVRDHGIGMRADQLARAFERFYRADSSGSIPGTGLGLSLVRAISVRARWPRSPCLCPEDTYDPNPDCRRLSRAACPDPADPEADVS